MRERKTLHRNPASNTGSQDRRLPTPHRSEAPRAPEAERKPAPGTGLWVPRPRARPAPRQAGGPRDPNPSSAELPRSSLSRSRRGSKPGARPCATTGERGLVRNADYPKGSELSGSREEKHWACRVLSRRKAVLPGNHPVNPDLPPGARFC